MASLVHGIRVQLLREKRMPRLPHAGKMKWTHLTTTLQSPRMSQGDCCQLPPQPIVDCKCFVNKFAKLFCYGYISFPSARPVQPCIYCVINLTSVFCEFYVYRCILTKATNCASETKGLPAGRTNFRCGHVIDSSPQIVR